jgi:hypothetical protein
MTPVAGSASVRRIVLRDQVQGCFRCDGCGALNIAIAVGLSGKQEPLAWLSARKNADWAPKRPVPPRPVAVKSFPDVPPEIAAAASEAYRCLNVAHVYRAAVLMARSVIEATAKAKGIRKGGLADKIDKMHEHQLIRPHVRDGAHEVRYLGNDMAHGDFVQVVTPEDAELVLTLMSEVLEDVYQSPARVARAQAKREERKELEARVAELLAKQNAQLPAGTSPLLQAMLTQYAAKPGIIRPADELPGGQQGTA